MLVRNLHFRGKHKLADRWESTIYVVQKKAGDMPVYTVCPEGQEGPLRTLHRDLLLPCGFLSEEDEEIVKPKKASKPKTRQTHISPEEYPPDSDDDGLSYYPTTIETTTRTIQPNNVNSNTKVTSEYETNVKEPDNLPKDLPSEILNRLVEKELTNPNGNISDETHDELELEKGTETETIEMEEDIMENSSQNKTPERVEQFKETEQKQSIEMDNTEKDACSVDDDDTPDHQTADQTRRSKRLRKPPVKFTYPHLGKPLLSFAQTILDGFNKELLETFEGAPTLVRT